MLQLTTAPVAAAALNSLVKPVAAAALPDHAGFPGSAFGNSAQAGPATEMTPALETYQKLRFGCSFHFGMPNFTGDDYDVGRVPASTYNPTHLDVRQWIKTAHNLGAKYAILVA